MRKIYHLMMEIAKKSRACEKMLQWEEEEKNKLGMETEDVLTIILYLFSLLFFCLFFLFLNLLFLVIPLP